MQLTLTVIERIRITDLFPDEEDIQTRVIARDVADKVEIGQDEMKAIEMKPAQMPDRTMGWTWNQKKAKNKKILFTRAEGQFLKKQVQERDASKKVKDEQLDVCLKIQEAKLNDKKKEKKQKGK